MLRHFVAQHYIHPILVNFTAALIPVSIGSDFLERIFNQRSLRQTGWWTMLYAACLTPLTVAAGWLFWMKDDTGVHGMMIHKWLGTSLAPVIIGMMLWRAWFERGDRRPGWGYLTAGILLIAVLAYQGHLGGVQVFQGM